MKYSSSNLDDDALALLRDRPMRLKILVDYRPDGQRTDYAPAEYTDSPEAYADRVVCERGWDQLPGFCPEDVWVSAGF